MRLRPFRRVVVTVCQRQVTTDGDSRKRCRNFAVQPLALGTGKCTATGNPRHVGPSFPVLCRVHDVPCSKSWSLRERCGSCNLRHHICIDAHHFISPEPLTHDILAQRQWALKRPSLDGATYILRRSTSGTCAQQRCSGPRDAKLRRCRPRCWQASEASPN